MRSLVARFSLHATMQTCSQLRLGFRNPYVLLWDGVSSQGPNTNAKQPVDGNTRRLPGLFVFPWGLCVCFQVLHVACYPCAETRNSVELCVQKPRYKARRSRTCTVASVSLNMRTSDSVGCLRKTRNEVLFYRFGHEQEIEVRSLPVSDGVRAILAASLQVGPWM